MKQLKVLELRKSKKPFEIVENGLTPRQLAEIELNMLKGGGCDRYCGINSCNCNGTCVCVQKCPIDLCYLGCITDIFTDGYVGLK